MGKSEEKKRRGEKKRHEFLKIDKSCDFFPFKKPTKDWGKLNKMTELDGEINGCFENQTNSLFK
jgi:hypothetical protein